MNIVTPNVEIIKQEQNDELIGIFKQIERAGRTCYKSEDKITDDSAKEFVENLIKRQHFAMLEHGTVYLKLTLGMYGNLFEKVVEDYEKNPYSFINVQSDEDFGEVAYITTNYRVIIENNWTEDLKGLCEPTNFHAKRITLKFTTNIGVTREGNRMRANSIAEESTRYCNYTKEKFGGEINICPPVWIGEEIGMLQTLDESEWMRWINGATRDENNPDCFNCDAITWYGMACAFAQVAYRNLILLGWKPQQAREILPLATKSDVVYTAFTYQWRHWFDLRLFGTTGKPHPNMKDIAAKASEVLAENNLWELIYPSIGESSF